MGQVHGQEFDIGSLIDLALDKSAEARALLAKRIAGLWSNGDTLTEREHDLAMSILGKLVSSFEQPIREALSEHFAADANAPHGLISLLANDEIEVARPILLQSSVLKDEELVELVCNRTRMHQLAVAQRHVVSEIVSDALVGMGDVEVITVLLNNQNARISEATLAYLTEKAKTVDSFQEPLLGRGELSPRLARTLYWWVGAALRTLILERFPLNPQAVDAEIETAINSLINQDPEVKRSEAQCSAARRLARNLAEERLLTPTLLLRVLKQSEVALFEAMFAELSGIEPPGLQRLLYDAGGETLAIVCRALDFRKRDLAALFLLTRGKGAVMHDRELAETVSAFDRVRKETAQHVIAFWRRHPEYQEAVGALGHLERNEQP